MALMWNEQMIDCRIGVGGAKRIGEMLEKNASLLKIVLLGENLLKSHSSPGVIYHDL
jgi:hypothetical protein